MKRNRGAAGGQCDAAETGAEVRERGDLEFDLAVIRERLVVELLLFAHGPHGTHRNAGGEEKDFVFLSVSVSSV